MLNILLVTRYPPNTLIEANKIAPKANISCIWPALESISAPTKAIPEIALAPDINGVWSVLGTFEISSRPRKIDKNKTLFNYEKKILINELILDLKLGYYDFEKEKAQKVKFSLEIDYQDKKPSNDKDLRSIVNYATIVKLIKKLIKKKHYNFLETLAEAVFNELFKDKRIGKIMLKIEKMEILKECSSVGIQITKKRSHDKFWNW